MSRNKRISGGKFIKPTFFVFCEGETEEAYINYLRSKYRLPIIIDAKIAGNRITPKYIHNYKKDKISHEKDQTFLVYDLDLPEMLTKLVNIKNVKLICSNPCFELWYLLHFQEHKTEITSLETIQKLTQHYPKYYKGVFSQDFKDLIETGQPKAIDRTGKLEEFQNPSSQLHKFIHELEKVKSQNN
jgi:hypothetical protein